MMLTNSEMTTNANGMDGTMLAVIELSGGRKYCDQAPGDAHQETDEDGDRQAAQPGRDDRGERGGDEQGEVVRIEPDDRRREDAGEARRAWWR